MSPIAAKQAMLEAINVWIRLSDPFTLALKLCATCTLSWIGECIYTLDWIYLQVSEVVKVNFPLRVRNVGVQF